MVTQSLPLADYFSAQVPWVVFTALEVVAMTERRPSSYSLIQNDTEAFFILKMNV